jgi:hypothetical protein
MMIPETWSRICLNRRQSGFHLGDSSVSDTAQELTHSNAPADNPLWEVSKEIERALGKHPTMRVGQILANVAYALHTVDLFYHSDEKIAKMIHKLYGHGYEL